MHTFLHFKTQNCATKLKEELEKPETQETQSAFSDRIPLTVRSNVDGNSSPEMLRYNYCCVAFCKTKWNFIFYSVFNAGLFKKQTIILISSREI